MEEKINFNFKKNLEERCNYCKMQTHGERFYSEFQPNVFYCSRYCKEQGDTTYLNQFSE